eukprot:scaffold211598_cov43-Prasinocladus_malaysianus.AAC.1
MLEGREDGAEISSQPSEAALHGLEVCRPHTRQTTLHLSHRLRADITEKEVRCWLRPISAMMAAKDHMISQLKDQLAQTTSKLGRAHAEAEERVEKERVAAQQAEARAAALAKEVERRPEPEEVSALKRQVAPRGKLFQPVMCTPCTHMRCPLL